MSRPLYPFYAIVDDVKAPAPVARPQPVKALPAVPQLQQVKP